MYAKCAAVEGAEREDEPLHQLRLDESTPNVKLIRTPRRRSTAVDRSALLGEPSHAENQQIADEATPLQNVPKAPVNENNLRYFQNAHSINWEEVLTNFYTIMNMKGKVAGIPTILKTWVGKEDEMVSSLMNKYEKTIPKKLLKYLQHVIQLTESRTDSSFRHPPPKVRMDL